jgi:hypothetical protein
MIVKVSLTMPATSDAYARLSAVFPGLRITHAAPPAGAGWLPAAELARGGPATARFVAGDVRRVGGAHGVPPRPDAAAALALHRYLWPACLLFTVPWFLHRRVPRLPVADVAFHPIDGHFSVRVREFACLPGDDAELLPGARTVAGPAALREELRTALAEHVDPVLAAFAPLVRRHPHALRRQATDEIAEGLWYIARLLGEERRAVAELTELLPEGARFRRADRTPAPAAPGSGAAPTGPCDSASASGATAGSAAEAGSAPASGSAPVRDRLTCCLFYTVSPGDTCAGCPRTRRGPAIRRPARTR